MRQLTEELWECAMWDNFPGIACKVDFGIEPPNEVEKFGALQWAIKHEQVTKEELDAALGEGPLLTEIVTRGDNPYACTITTSWDDIGLEEED